EIELWDINYGLSIDDTQVRNISAQLQVFANLNDVKYYMSYDVFSGRWSVTIPGTATILEALRDYDIRLFASFKNYESATDSIQMYIQQTATQLRVIGIPDPTKLEVYYLQNVTLQLNFTTAKTTEFFMDINDGNVSWIDSTRKIYLNFTSIGNGIWTLTFNTSILGFGTVGVSFYGDPSNATLASTLTSMTLTVKKIPTSIEGPTEIIDLVWGWTGYISLNFSDEYNMRYVSGAAVTYNYGNLDFNATDLGNGTYSLYIDTTILGSNVRERISTSFILPNYEERSYSFFIRVNERPTELIVGYPDQNFVSIEQGIIYLELTMGDSIDISLFYNDISSVGGFSGGITNANFTEFTELRAPAYFGSSAMPIVFLEGFGFYNFTFDTNYAALYAIHNGPVILEGEYFRFAIEIFYEHRKLQTIEIRISIITTPTAIEHNGQVVDPNVDIPYTLINGETIEYVFYLNDTWHSRGIDDAAFFINLGITAIISSNSSLGNGFYRIVIQAVGYGGIEDITIIMKREFHDDAIIVFRITTQANDFDILFQNITRYGLPISIFIIALLGAYVKVWSVPKRIRQINSQLKTLRKGKIPKPVKDVKTRQQLAAELFNDTFDELKITRTAAQMPEEAIPIEVPEMGELLMQLAILTHLNAEELDDFQADIKKMKMSEQAAFVKEVIMQEAIRVARREGKTIEETLANIQQEALRRLGGEETEEPVEPVEPEVDERVFLEEEEKDEVVHKETITPEYESAAEEAPEIESDKMTLYEIEELRKDLERKGVPPHEIETIIEQAKALPRDLVDELVKSLEGKKE
ncbi:MAG: Ig-like domain-containing protein, partial [Candidatus Thorarchaeota archaeon]